MSKTSEEPRLPGGPVRRLLALVSLVALVVAALAFVSAPSAQAAPQNVTASSLKWGVKSSFRTYIVAIAGGSVTASGGATKDNASATAPYTWAGAGGTYDPDTKTGTLDFAGTVVFRAINHTIWNITISNPSVVLDGDATGTLVVDVSYSTGGTEANPESTGSQADVAFGDVAVGTPAVSGSTSTYADQAVTLTQAGSEAFGGFYSAGTAMDALTATATLPGGPSVSVTTASLASGLVGKTYSATFAATGGKPAYTWSVAAGSLPAGVRLSPQGRLSGTPSAPGTSSFTVQVKDKSKPSALVGTRQLTITIAPMTVLTSSVPGGSVGTNYVATTFRADGGKGGKKWSVVSGGLPPGLKLAAAGRLSGKPTIAGSYTFTVQVADSAWPKNLATKVFTIVVAG